MDIKSILRGVHVRIGPLPVRMSWDLEMLRWCHGPVAVPYPGERQKKPECVEAAADVPTKPLFDITAELHRVPTFMLSRSGVCP